ncbi:MAG: hypothetical protein IJV31_00625 [Clostridia bacterium]|nr:hypothetical protein [Clostridia bacterium]
MKVFRCEKCKSIDVFIDKANNHTGLYCGDCGKWIKWLAKDEIRLVERQINSKIDNKINSYYNNQEEIK